MRKVSIGYEVHCLCYSNLYFERRPKDLEISQDYKKNPNVYVKLSATVTILEWASSELKIMAVSITKIK